MNIKRDFYLKQLVDSMWDGQVKVVTGLRRCGKSYLLKNLFGGYLRENGVADDQVILLELDLLSHAVYRNPIKLVEFVRGKVPDDGVRRYLFIDEIQLCEEVENPVLPNGKKLTFYDALNEFKSLPNLDVYVTGSNSKMLSSDILTEFRGRGNEIRVHPFSFGEYLSARGGDKREALNDYLLFGGMPYSVGIESEEKRMQYLKGLFAELYLKDIVERKQVQRLDVLNATLDLMASSIGSLTNPNNVANVLTTKLGLATNVNTVRMYMDHLMDAFLFSEAKRYDVRGKAYFDYPNKYYCEDLGLRNARTGFREQDMTHLMENAIYLELVRRGFSVDVGVVFSWETNKLGKRERIAREIDFVVNKGGEKVYVQSAYRMDDEEKRKTELKPFALSGDSFRKIVVRDDIGHRFFDDLGVLNISLVDFLQDSSVVI